MAEIRAGRGKAPPGEYVVRHERPYPERLERAFRIGARVAAAASVIVVPLFLLVTAARPIADPSAWAVLAALAAAGAALAYAAIWAAGALLIGVVVAFRRKQYVVDWEERPPER